MARRGSRAEQYLAIAAFYGAELIRDMQNPYVPEFVIQHAARRAAHYALTGLRMRDKVAKDTPDAAVLVEPRWPALVGARA